MCGDWIVSASEDQTVAVWDQRAGKVLKKIKLYENKVSLLQLEYSNSIIVVFWDVVPCSLMHSYKYWHVYVLGGVCSMWPSNQNIKFRAMSMADTDIDAIKKQKKEGRKEKNDII